MTGRRAASSQAVRIERVFPASPKRVYEAWTQPDQFRQWFRPPECVTESARFELHPGGRFEILLRNEASGVRFPIVGVFRIVEPDRRLRFTWSFGEPGGPSCETLVTVDFERRQNATRVVLLHEYLPSPQAAENQQEVLKKCLDQLARYLGSRQP